MIGFIVAEIPDVVYTVEFRHWRDGGPRFLPRYLGLAAITQCALIITRGDGAEFCALGMTACELGDQFSRRVGRLKALANALSQCRAIPVHAAAAILGAYVTHTDPPRPATPPRPKLDDVEKKARWEAGWEKRQLREIARAERGHT